MTPTIDDKQNRTIMLIIGVLGALGGVVALMAYIDSHKHTQLKEDILRLDREIKALELYKKQNEVA